MSKFRIEERRARLTESLRELASEGRGWALTVVALGWLLLLGTRLIFPALLPEIKTAYGLNNATAGGIISAISITVATMQFPSGVLADRVGERIVLVIGMVVAAIGLTILSTLPVLPAFLVGGILFGIGMGSFGSPRVMVLSNLYPKRDGTAIGITFSAGHVGTSTLPFVAGTLMILFGWQVGFLYVIPLFLFTAFGLWRFVPARTERASSETHKSRKAAIREILSVVTRRQILLTFLALSLWSFTFVGITTFLPTYLITEKGLSPQSATAIYSLLFVTGLFAQAGAGNVADRHGYRRVLLPLSAISIVPLFVFPFADGVWLLGGLVLLMGTRLGLMPVTNAYLISAVPDESQGSSYGLVRSFQAYIGSTGAVFVGFLADSGLFDEAFLILAGSTVIMTVIYLALPVEGS
ncbi:MULTISPECIES: MFS transporter [Salinibaculum]|uniref:MFS transporter n=1 Tax=Salinibaculum TaxID=2732368 RepID=UPI0030CBCA50